MRTQHPRVITALLLALMVSVFAVTSAASAATRPVAGMDAFCLRPSTSPGVAISCTVHVAGNPIPTGTISFSVPSWKGVVSPTVCFVSNGDCAFSYTPKGTGSNTRKDSITASYSGDAVYDAAKITVVVFVRPMPEPNFGMGCISAETTPGVPVQCEVFLSDSGEGAGEPTGNVTFTVPSYKGFVSPGGCFFNTGGTCTLTYTPVGNGSGSRKDVITATYSGNGRYAAAKTTTTVFVGPKPAPALSFFCGSSTTPNVSVGCAMHMTGSLGSPTGTVTFTVPSYKGVVSPSGCSAATGCNPVYTPKGTGTATRKDTITATYPGDTRYAAVKATWTIAVHAP
jgi:hypothetical protein